MHREGKASTDTAHVSARLGAIGRLVTPQLERSLLVGIAGTMLLNGATTALNFALTLVLARALGAVGYGAYAFAFAWALVLSTPAAIGLSPLLIRNVSAYQAQSAWGLLRGLVVRANQVVVVTSALVAVSAALGFWLVDNHASNRFEPSLVGLILVPLIALTTVRQAIMQGLGRVVLGRVAETVVSPLVFLALVLLVPALTSSLSPVGAIGCQIAATALAFALGVYLLKRVMPHNVHGTTATFDMRPWTRSAVPLVAFSALQAMNAQIEVILLGVLRGAEPAGLFSVASRAANVVSFVSLAASYALLPALSRMYAAGENEALRATVRIASRALFATAIPIALVVVAFAHPLLSLFGADFAGGTTALVLLCISQVLWVATALSGIVLIATGNETKLTRAVALGVVLNFALNGALIPVFGLSGAAAASAIVSLPIGLLLSVYARRAVGYATSAFGV